MSDQVSAAYVDSVICNRVSMHEGLMRNQFYCPKLKDNIMTGDFMKGIIGYQRYWLPQTADIRIRNCVTPPSRNELAEMVAEQMRRTER